MKYIKPQLLNVKKASSTIMGSKQTITSDNGTPSSTNVAYRNDE